MIFISKLIAKFIKAVLSLLTESEEFIETSEVIVSSVGAFTSSDKVIQNMPIVNTYWLPDNGEISCVGEGLMLIVPPKTGDNGEFYYTQDFSRWTKIPIQGISGWRSYLFAGRVLPNGTPTLGDGFPSAFGHSMIEPVVYLNQPQGVTNNSLLLSREPEVDIEPNKIAYLSRWGGNTFLYRGRRVYNGDGWACVSNKLNNIESVISPGWFTHGGVAYQAYSPVEREILYKRMELPNPSSGIVVNNVAQSGTVISNFILTSGLAEDVYGNMYGLHSAGSSLVLTKNYVAQPNYIIDSLETISNIRESSEWMVGETGSTAPRIAIIGEDIFISQFNKVFKLNNNLELQNIYEVPFCVQQMTADISHLYLVHKGGVTKCLP